MHILLEDTYRKVVRKGGSKKGVKRKERRERPMMGDKPRWNLDDAKFGKRRLVCVCIRQETC